MSTRTIKYTYQDYLLFPEDNNRHEIIDGEHYMTPSPMTRHQRISKNLFILLNRFATEHETGEVFYAPTDVILSDTDVVVPDLLFVSQGRSSMITEKNIQGAPDLIIEILSPSTAERDQQLKRKTYAKFGVKEYWIVDPDTSTIQVLHLHQDDYRTINTFSAGQTLKSPIFPGLSLSLTDVFKA